MGITVYTITNIKPPAARTEKDCSIYSEAMIPVMRQVPWGISEDRRMGFYMGYTYNKNYLIKTKIHGFRYGGDSLQPPGGVLEGSLRKMKAGGITVAATYVFWIHHEEEEGAFVFEGCRDLKKFVELLP